MKNQMFKRMICWLLVACMVLPFIPAASAARVSWKQVDCEIAVDVPEDRKVQKDGAAERDVSEMVRVSIVLEGASTVEAGYATMGIGSNAAAMAYSAELQKVQKRMEKTISVQALDGRPLDVVWNMTLVGNIISAWVPYGSLEKIAAIPGVKTVAMEAQYEPAVAERKEGAVPTTYPSSGMIGSGVLWNGGYTGAGTRIAIVDTGTDTDHQSFDNGAYLYALQQNANAKGMELDAYMASLDMLGTEEISEVLPNLHVSKLAPDVTAEQLYLNEKLAFGFNYVDGNLNIVHDNDQQGEHGSHVAGISTANRYIPTTYGGYTDARDSVLMLGVAPDAQLITMKVFGEGSPYDSDYMAAIEDAIMLGCDAVNLSMGTTMPGSPYTDVYSGLMDMMTETDTVVVISAGNASNWAVASIFGYLYSEDVSFDTVGAPGSYASAFTVASVENDGTVGHYFEAAGKKCFYYENMGFGNTSLLTLDTSLNLDGTEYEYVLIDGLGYPEDYAGLDVSGKIVLVSRGTLNFAEKANNAAALGAVAVMVYNNVEDLFAMDLTGLKYAVPVVSVLQSDALAIMADSEKINDIAYTGKLTVYGKQGVGIGNSEYYTMSDFSSWGVPSSLTLKPEITAPGGNIYSLWGSNPVTGGGSDKYETMSGTSMAAPQVTGMAALLAQACKENGMTEASGISARHLAQSLLMSTAQPLLEEASGGNYYSLMNQGAGLARVDLAASADSYVKVTGQDDYKVKAELGDDPQRTGVYEFEFTLNNLTDSEKVYALSADLFRQDVFEYQEGSEIWLLDTWTTGLDADVSFYSDALAGPDVSCDLNGDGVTNAADADYLTEYVVGNVNELKADGDLSGDGQINSYDAHLLLASLGGDTVTIPAKGSVTVQVRMALTEEAKAELDAEAPNGTFVEAFVYACGVADAEGNAATVHSIPVLAFYGSWAEPTMYDHGTLLDLVYMTSNTAPYLYQAIGPYGNTLGIDYGDGTEYYYGGNPVLDDAHYLPERNAFSSTSGAKLTEQGFTLIRGAGAARIQVTNAVTGEVYMEKQLGELYPTYYNPSYGQWENTIQYAKLNWTGTDASGEPLADGTVVDVTLTAIPHYYRQEDGSYSFEDAGEGSHLTTTFTIDNTAPEATDIDLSQLDADKLTVKAKDNRYVAAVALLNANGTKFLNVLSPNQTEKGAEVTVELDLTDIYGNNFLVAVFDYAQNMTVYEVELNLGSPERHYFTAIDYSTMTYVSVDMAGQTSPIADTGLPVLARAAEYVGGYVFTVTEDNSLCVANDEDLTITERICKLDPYGELLMTSVNDLAYNYADGKLYIQYYSQYNDESAPYLAEVNMGDGTLKQICELPTDVNTMAIATDGTFYSAGFNSNILYKYTLDDILSGKDMTMVGEMGYYYSAYLTSMAWDHNTGMLYWAFPNTLVKIDPETAEPTLLGYHEAMLVGLYTRPEYDEGMFDPVGTVDRVELNLNETRIMVGSTYPLEATVWPWNASDRTVTWTSSDETIATVDNQGSITAKGLGECVITATSNLDPTKSASCTIATFELEKTLNGLVWDEEGYVWMSEFSTTTIPEYTKLHDVALDLDLASATLSQDGSIYAASLDADGLHSDLYKLDPVTFQPTLVGPSTDGYVDLAPAPGQPGNSLMAVFGGNVMQVDAVTGDYYNWYYMFSNNLVALAYVGTQEYKEWGYDTMVDWYFIIDRVGYVYLMGFLEQDGAYYYLEHDQLAPGGIYTKLNFEMETPYFGSAYFDGEMLYYSAYKESRDNVTLMAIDVAGGSKACYELGTFATGVWPVAGLMELDGFENHIDIILGAQEIQTLAQPTPAEPQAELKGIRAEKAEGTLNNAVAPMSNTDVKDGLVYVDVTLLYAGTNADMTVSFDTDKLELVDVSGRTTAFGWKAEDGEIRLSLAEAEEIADTKTVARLTFRAIGEGSTTVSIVTGGLGDEGCGYDERLELALGHKCPSEHFVDVNEGDWWHEAVDYVVEKGYMNGMDTTHFGPGATMNRAQFVTVLYRMEGSPAVTNTGVFTDVPAGQFYTEAAYWALETGITTGATASTFNPGGQLTRTELVTFMYRYAKLKGYDLSATADLSGYRDESRILGFAVEPWKWAVTHGIVSGVTSDTLAPMNLTNRAQAATIFQRFDKTFA